MEPAPAEAAAAPLRGVRGRLLRLVGVDPLRELQSRSASAGRVGVGAGRGGGGVPPGAAGAEGGVVKACERCGIALAPSHGGAPQRMMVVWSSGATTTADLCRGCYEPAVRTILEAILSPAKRES